MPFELPKLSYTYNALEPFIDAKTMEIHHSKHHNAYVTNLNKAIEGTPKSDLPLMELITKHIDVPAIRNNGGGHWNHSFFWELLKVHGGVPTKEVETAINAAFGNFENFKKEFTTAATTRFGSGWAWLCVKKDKTLAVCSTANQDNPLMPNVGCEGTPILALDVWEHAYYLNYQNRRPDYIEAFFTIINWEQVAKNFSAAK